MPRTPGVECVRFRTTNSSADGREPIRRRSASSSSTSTIWAAPIASDQSRPCTSTAYKYGWRLAGALARSARTCAASLAQSQPGWRRGREDLNCSPLGLLQSSLTQVGPRGAGGAKRGRRVRTGGLATLALQHGGYPGRLPVESALVVGLAVHRSLRRHALVSALGICDRDANRPRRGPERARTPTSTRWWTRNSSSRGRRRHDGLEARPLARAGRHGHDGRQARHIRRRDAFFARACVCCVCWAPGAAKAGRRAHGKEAFARHVSGVPSPGSRCMYSRWGPSARVGGFADTLFLLTWGSLTRSLLERTTRPSTHSAGALWAEMRSRPTKIGARSSQPTPRAR